AVAWGSADFCAKKASTRFGFWPTVWGMNAVGALAMAVVWAAGGVAVSAPQLPLWIGVAVGNTVGGVFFYFALEHGPLALVSPVTAAYPVVSAVLAYVMTGERLGPLMLAAVGGVIAGTLLASVGAGPAVGEHPRRSEALLAAVASALIFGSVFYALAAHSSGASATAPVLIFRFAGALLLAMPLLFGWRYPGGLWRSGWVWATGLLDTGAYLLYAEGGKHLPVSVVSALSGLFTVWTLVLAVLFLRERLAWRQWLGVGLILAAIAMLSSYGGMLKGYA
ncbi:MAG: DMT family transporter, partial [Terriglobales bacterium]